MKRSYRSWGLLVILGLSIVGEGWAQTRYEKEQEAWRRDREEKLKAEDGWLTVTGLFWLREGRNEVGSAPTNDIVLSSACATPHLGAFELEEGKVTLRVAEGVPVKIDGQLVREASLAFVANSSQPIVLGDLTLLVLKRGARYGLRVKDQNAPARRDFTGLRWYPAQEAYRVEATLHAYEQPKEVPIMNLLGDIETYRSPGLLRFTIKGQDYSLEPLLGKENRLFIIFRDLTSNRTTYGAARFLYAPAPVEGKVILDFNQAINPPCAFTIYATCPLPPQQNRLKVAIEAGELIYHHAIPHQAINR